MGVIVDFIRRCVAAGMDSEAALIAAEQFELSAPMAETASKAALRTRRWRERKSSQTVTKRHQTSQTVTCDAPLPQNEEPALPFNTENHQTPFPPPIVPRPFVTAFETFWTDYPNKVGKRAAETAYFRASKRSTPADIGAGLQRAKTSRDWIAGYIPHPTTWLNQDRWLDEPDNALRAPPASAGMLAAAAREAGFRIAMENRKNGNGSSDYAGDSGVVVALPRLNQIPR